MSSIRSPNVVFFYGATIRPNLCMVMEFCHKGTLFDVLNDKAAVVDWPLFFKFAKDMVRGTWCLHSWKPQIVHRDLKTLNLLVDQNNTVKVCDFGQSRFTEGQASNSTLAKLRGTYHYCAPEVYFGKRFTTKSDVFSIGVILWELGRCCVLFNLASPGLLASVCVCVGMCGYVCVFFFSSFPNLVYPVPPPITTVFFLSFFFFFF
jgi:serine/threonine protein kinase